MNQTNKTSDTATHTIIEVKVFDIREETREFIEEHKEDFKDLAEE